MPAPGYAVFDTALGPCALVWDGPDVIGVQLPEASARATAARVAARFPGASPAAVPRVHRGSQRAIVDLLRGKHVDLGAVPLALERVPAFHRRVYELARTIPPGSTITYGDLARRLGSPGSARAVGQAMGKNPFPIVVPCHRVLAAGGKPGGFTAHGGADTKLRMLDIERGRAPAPAQKARTKRAGEGGSTRARLAKGGLRYDRALALAHLAQADATLARAIERLGPYTLSIAETHSVFAALVRSIVHQQLSTKAAETIHGRLCALFPASHGGPSPEDLASTEDARLRGVGLSQNKLLALRDLAARTQRGEVPSLADAHALDDDALIERLTAVRGIGRWTVEMLLMFRLGRGDVLPVDDLGIRKGFAAVFRRGELASRDEVAERGERWRPYRTVASWYLWRAAEAARAKEQALSARAPRAQSKPTRGKAQAKPAQAKPRARPARGHARATPTKARRGDQR